MKKMFLTLATLAIFTACSTNKEVKDTQINVDLNSTEEILVVETVEIDSEVAEVIQTEITSPTEEGLKTIYNNGGLVITTENNDITLVMPTDVTFGFDKFNIKDDFKPVLNLVADALESNSDITANISGYTDSIGTEEYNEKLSTLRAEEAKKYLISQGIDSERILAIGYGFKKPVASNEKVEGRERNRRIEITLTR